ncbi:MAG: chromosomal replication initiator protein DnaA [Sphingomonadales bacterium]
MNQSVDLEGQWIRTRECIRAECGQEVFETWLKNLEFRGVEAGILNFAARTTFVRDRVKRHYADILKEIWIRENGMIFAVEIFVGRNSSKSSEYVENVPEKNITQLNACVTDSFGGPLDPRYSFESFVVGKSNELAYAASQRVAECAEVPFNPLFLHGGVGLGKTHLMHAIAAEVITKHPNKKVMYLSAEKFMYEFITALRYKDTVAFKKQFRNVDLLMIDDVQFISNKNTTQEEFFHTFNALVDNRRQVVISADRSPTDLTGIEDRIISRLGWGLVADIHPTDYELRLGILQSKREKLSEVDISEEVVNFLASRITSNVRELEGALNRVVAYATLVGRPISMDMTREVLQDLLRANDRKVTIDDIQRQVAEYYNLRLAELLSARRARNIARPRQVAMYLSKQMTQRSLPEIGRKFGGRDHTTVMHAVKKVDDLRLSDSGLDDDIHRLSRMLEG